MFAQSKDHRPMPWSRARLLRKRFWIALAISLAVPIALLLLPYGTDHPTGSEGDAMARAMFGLWDLQENHTLWRWLLEGMRYGGLVAWGVSAVELGLLFGPAFQLIRLAARRTPRICRLAGAVLGLIGIPVILYMGSFLPFTLFATITLTPVYQFILGWSGLGCVTHLALASESLSKFARSFLLRGG